MLTLCSSELLTTCQLSTIFTSEYVIQGRNCVLGVKTPPKLFAIFLVSQLCLFVQQNIFRLRLLNIGVCLNYLQCQFMLDLIYINSKSQSSMHVSCSSYLFNICSTMHDVMMTLLSNVYNIVFVCVCGK